MRINSACILFALVSTALAAPAYVSDDKSVASRSVEVMDSEARSVLTRGDDPPPPPPKHRIKHKEGNDNLRAGWHPLKKQPGQEDLKGKYGASATGEESKPNANQGNNQPQ